MEQPAIVLDIDGVISPMLRVGQTLEDLKRESWSDFAAHYVGTAKNRLNISREMCHEIINLGLDIVWMSDWFGKVDELIVPYTGFQREYEQISYDYNSYWQAEALVEYMLNVQRGIVWCYCEPLTQQEEDQIFDVADDLDLSIMLIKCDEDVGILPGDIEDIHEFLNSEYYEEEEEEHQNV